MKDRERLRIKVFFLHPGAFRGAGEGLPANRAPRPYFEAFEAASRTVSMYQSRRQARLAETADRLLVALGAFMVGMAAGVLLAPREGASTRRILSDGARTAASGAGALAERHLPLAGEWDVVDGAALVRDLREGRP